LLQCGPALGASAIARALVGFLDGGEHSTHTG
jgi:hypothetical protein